jgi:hypothetical protein
MWVVEQRDLAEKWSIVRTTVDERQDAEHYAIRNCAFAIAPLMTRATRSTAASRRSLSRARYETVADICARCQSSSRMGNNQ